TRDDARAAAAAWLRSQVEAIREDAERETRRLRRELADARARLDESPPTEPTEKLSLASASFEELRAVGMSVTQAQRVIEYREANRGFDSVDELDSVPGFEYTVLVEVKRRLAP
ncbi:MAG: ComEA family DNA-binding protein, partial [Solirubrobacterales bacterium]